MGPPLFSDGDIERQQQDAERAAASMGPPLFSDGDMLCHEQG